NQGNAVVYISLDDELTLYSWEGEPSAYLKHNQNNEFDVYGFNGNHLGWFTNGMLIDHDGYVACAVKDMVTTPNLPSLKSLKSLKPLKSLTELPPLFPLLKNAFGQTNCSLLVASGVA
ncbi:4-fold beta flower protein, partial [Escherichia coli]|uniref:4-fold beta flower protein n=3 Tax=Enterobacterales TaxID=91347 RepID=UPI003CFCFB58